MFKTILRELKSHVPFTLLGALTGTALMVLIVLMRVERRVLEPVFEGLHSGHVLLSAVVTAATFRRYRKGVVAGVLVGLAGSLGIASLSDVIFPHHGGAMLLGLAGGSHSMDFHLPLLEEWWLVVPSALVGTAIGMTRPATKIPHAGHVLLSIWASLFYLAAHSEAGWRMALLPLVYAVLFLAVWVPCCLSDIVFPLLFVGRGALEHAHDHGDHPASPG
ncbi:MAG: hypothetical protein QGI33_04715 [Candidatus Brocadiia bacterium]|jgi:hypothetical protein|nr:hypothetical protein [Candidatus Brocadiia bacterium]